MFFLVIFATIHNSIPYIYIYDWLQAKTPLIAPGNFSRYWPMKSCGYFGEEKDGVTCRVFSTEYKTNAQNGIPGIILYLI